MLAEATGGFAVVNDNDFDEALKRIDAETSDYYILGYYASNPDPKHRNRRVEVKTRRPDVAGLVARVVSDGFAEVKREKRKVKGSENWRRHAWALSLILAASVGLGAQAAARYPHHVSDLRVASGPGGISARRRRAPQLRVRRGQ